MSAFTTFQILIGITLFLLIIAGFGWYRWQFNAKTFLQRGVAYLAEGKVVQAVGEFSQAIHYEPHNAEAFFQRGLAHKAMYDMESAIADFGEAIRLNPNHIQAHCQRAKIHSYLERTDTAISDLTQLLTARPNLIEIYDVRVELYVKQGNTDKAIADCTQMIILDPQSSDAYSKRAILYLHQNEREKALTDFGQAIRSNPHNHIAFNERGLLRESFHDISGAITDYEQAIALHPTFCDAHFNLSLAYTYQNNNDVVQKGINKALTINSSLDTEPPAETSPLTTSYQEWLEDMGEMSIPAAYMLRGAARMGEYTLFTIPMKDFVGGMADLKRAIQLDDRFTMAYLARGGAYYEQGKSFLALRDLFHFARLGGISELYRLIKKNDEGQDLPSEAEFSKEFWGEINGMVRETTLKEKSYVAKGFRLHR